VRLAAIILCMVALTHYGYDPLASFYADHGRAGRAIFYAMRGLEGAALFALAGILSRSSAVALACLWGAVEEGQTAVCRLAAGIETVPVVPAFSGLCGADAYWLGIVIAAVIAVMFLDKIRGKK
jgi:hypothetical protein